MITGASIFGFPCFRSNINFLIAEVLHWHILCSKLKFTPIRLHLLATEAVKLPRGNELDSLSCFSIGNEVVPPWLVMNLFAPCIGIATREGLLLQPQLPRDSSNLDGLRAICLMECPALHNGFFNYIWPLCHRLENFQTLDASDIVP